jgi:Protein of unknown function (DUF3037)
MPEKRQLEFFLLRYVLDVVKGEFVNFGLVTLADSGNGAELIDVRFARNWERVLRLDPQADVDVLEAMRRELQAEIGHTQDRTSLWRRMEDSFSGVVQVSSGMPAVTEQPVQVEIETVAKQFLEAPVLSRTRELSGTQKIRSTMRDELERSGVLSLLRPIPAYLYTKKPGDPFTFDFGYFVGRELKLLHAVSLKTRVDAGVLLAARYPEIRAAMLNAEDGVVPSLTAMVDADLNVENQEIGFALAMMREKDIRVETVNRMPAIATEIKRELGL